MESLSFVQWCLDNLNYWTITLLMTIESSFIPFPSEVVIIPAAYKAAYGQLNIYAVVICGTIGSNLGAIINYGLARSIGRTVVYKFANSRIGHICLLDQKKVETAERFFYKHGSISTLIGRLIPAVRQLISIPAGLARMKFSSFILFTTLGALSWNIVLAAIGYGFHSIMPEDELVLKVHTYSNEILYALIAICTFIVGFLIYKGLKTSK